MSNRFATNNKALAECDICGFRYKLKELRDLIVRGNNTNLKACIECWGPDHPQNRQGMFPVHDPQAIRDPRPDFAGLESSRKIQWGWNPVGNGNNPFDLTDNDLVGTGSVGSVTITTT